MRFSNLWLCLFALLSFTGSHLGFSQSNHTETFDQFLTENREKFSVPGCAVTVVKDGEVLFTKAYGVRSLSDPQAVDEHTLFGMMSTTKATTAVAMALLVDEGRVDWDDRVIDYLPDFQLSDPYITRELRIRDLFTHNAGLGNADFLWIANNLSQEEILHRMRLAPIAYSFRGGYTYQNIMYLVAGKLIEKVSGMSWERFMKEKIYQPLGMKHTFPNIAYSAQYQNKSRPHYLINGKVVEIEEESADAIGPAGSAWSTADDIGKWVQFMLDSARVGEDRLLSAETYAELLTPQIIVPRSSFYPTTRLTRPHWTTYALGWFQQDYRGDFLSFHTGSLAGRTAIIGLMPDHNFGVYFFGNLDHAELRHAVMLKAIDLFVYDDDARDWGEEIYQLYHGQQSSGLAQQEEKLLSQRKTGTKPTLPDSAYVGSYNSPFFGQVKVSTTDDGELFLKISDSLSSKLAHWHYDVFSLDPYLKAYLPFQLIEFHIDPAHEKVIALEFFSIWLENIRLEKE